PKVRAPSRGLPALAPIRAPVTSCLLPSSPCRPAAEIARAAGKPLSPEPAPGAVLLEKADALPLFDAPLLLSAEPAALPVTSYSRLGSVVSVPLGCIELLP